MARKIALEHHRVIPRQQNFGRARGNDHRAMSRRIQRLEVVNLHVSELGSKCHVNVALKFYPLKVRMVANHGKLSLKTLRVGNNVFDRLQFGHIHAGFRRHVQVKIRHAQASFFVAFNGAAYTAFAPVVSCQCQVPVTKHAVQFLQIIQCCAG